MKTSAILFYVGSKKLNQLVFLQHKADAKMACCYVFYVLNKSVPNMSERDPAGKRLI